MSPSPTDATAINFTATNPVGTASPVMTTPSSLPDATVGASYTHTLVAAASGGKAPYHYECTSLDWWPPPGLTVDTNGNLTGTPTQAGTYGVAVDVGDANGNRSLSKTVLINVITPHAVTSIAPFWVYHNGVFAWGGDYSSGAVPNYTSTAGAPESGPYDIALSITGPWGVWAPYAGGSVPVWDFDASGYNYITMDLKPTVANQRWQFYFEQVHDVSIIGPNGQRTMVNPADYGPAPVVGKWATYRIPLSVVLTQYASGKPVYETGVYKFGLQDETGLARNLWYIDNVAFTQ